MLGLMIAMVVLVFFNFLMLVAIFAKVEDILKIKVSESVMKGNVTKLP